MFVGRIFKWTFFKWVIMKKLGVAFQTFSRHYYLRWHLQIGNLEFLNWSMAFAAKAGYRKQLETSAACCWVTTSDNIHYQKICFPWTLMGVWVSTFKNCMHEKLMDMDGMCLALGVWRTGARGWVTCNINSISSLKGAQYTLKKLVNSIIRTR